MNHNCLAIDYGTKRIGLAYSVQNIISPLPAIANDSSAISKISAIISANDIKKIYIGVSEGRLKKLTLSFVSRLSSMLKLPVETVEEAVSTIEAAQVLKENRRPKKSYKSTVDSVAAAVILRRVIN